MRPRTFLSPSLKKFLGPGLGIRLLADPAKTFRILPTVSNSKTPKPCFGVLLYLLRTVEALRTWISVYGSDFYVPELQASH